MTTVATDIRQEAMKHKAEVEELTSVFDESTGATWLWAGLFGPFYFLVHGMWVNILLSFVVAFVTALVFAMSFPNDEGLGIILSVIVIWFVEAKMAYRTWRDRAERKATNMALIRR